MTKIQYVITFLRKSDIGYCVLKQLKLKQIKESVNFNDKEFLIDIKSPNFHSGNLCYYFFDYDSGSQIKFNETKTELNPDEVDLLLRKHLIKDLAIGIKSDKNQYTLFHIIAIGLLGFLVASVIFIAYFNNKIQKILEEYQNITVPPAASIFSLLKIYWRCRFG